MGHGCTDSAIGPEAGSRRARTGRAAGAHPSGRKSAAAAAAGWVGPLGAFLTLIRAAPMSEYQMDRRALVTLYWTGRSDICRIWPSIPRPEMLPR